MAIQKRIRGLTLIELLTVIAIMVILGAILLPILNGARHAGLRAKSKTQFGQWMMALEGFHQEYGYYPFLDSSGDTMFAINESGNRILFEQVLSGEEIFLNRRGIRFYTLTEEELVDPSVVGSPIQDAFGNTSILILIDGDRDGRIQVGDFDVRGSLEVVALEDPVLGYPKITTWNEGK